MIRSRTMTNVIAVSVLIASLWGCAKKEGKSRGPSDSNSEASSQSLGVDKRVVAQENMDSSQERARLSGLRVCTLTLGPIGPSPAGAPLLLFPDPNTLADADAYPLYERAIKALRPSVPDQRLSDWLKIEGPGFPVEEAKETLALFDSSLAQLELASKCRQCKWPEVEVMAMAMLEQVGELRQLIKLVATEARVQIEQRRFDEAAASFQQGLTLVYHMGQAPLSIQGVFGAAMEDILVEQMRHWVQAPGSPSLYGAIAALPPSLVDIDRQLKVEADNMSFLERIASKRSQKEASEAAQYLVKSADRGLATLQTIEAIRHYASTHQGRFPRTLGELSLAVPNDPSTGQPFGYRLEQEKAIIEGSPDKLIQHILKWR